MSGLRFAALRHRDFAFFLAGQFIWTVALQVQAVALAWQIYDMTASPFQLGLVGLMEFLPSVLLALVTGPLADRLDRRNLLLTGLCVELLAGIALLALALTGLLSAEAILAVALVFGTARALATPAGRALMPNLMPAGQLADGIAWSSSTWQIATIGGPALGGLLYAVAPAAAYGVAAGALAAAFAATLAMRSRPVERSAEPGGIASVMAGLTMIFRHQIILGAISLDLFAVLFSGASALVPVFARDILLAGPDGAGILRSAFGLGGVATALALTQWPLSRRVGRRLLIAVGLFGAAAVLFGLSDAFWLSFAALLVMGAADMVSIYIRGTLVPLATPDAMRGRVLAVETVFIGASNEFGAFVAGSGAALLGPVAAVVAGGSLTMIVALLCSRLFPKLRAVDRMDHHLAFQSGGADDSIPAPGEGGRA